MLRIPWLGKLLLFVALVLINKDLGNYLGVPLIHGRISKTIYKDIVSKVQGKLAAWKSANLSLAGRLIVATTLPVYVMQSIKLPLETCDKLDGLNKNFLWGHSQDMMTVHLVKWKIVYCPKEAGGLGVKSMRLWNQALLTKAGWRLILKDGSLWSNMLHAKYVGSKNLVDVCRSKAVRCFSM
ncbi:hypothetical protein ACOSQ4_014880 [Xanthoceras sorbifolium]